MRWGIVKLGWPRSLFGQLLLSQVMLFAVAAPIVPIAMGAVLQRTADDFIEGRLRNDAMLIATSLSDPESRDVVRELGPQYDRHGATRGFRIIDADRRIVSAGGAIDRFPPPAWAAPSAFGRYGDLDIFQQPMAIARRSVLIQVAQDRSRPEVIVDDIVATFLHRAWWIVPAMLWLSLLAGAIVARRLTARLRGASRDANRIGPDNLGARIAIAPLPVEVRGLAAATNAALDRVEDGYRRQAAFVASVAHELRTPLALVMLRCDALPPTPRREALRRAIDQSTHVVSQLMELAVIDGHQPAIGPVDVADVVDQLLHERAGLVVRSGRSIEAAVEVSAGRVIGNAGLLSIAVGNLIDNAVRHTPVGTRIVLAGRRGEVSVGDDGPGLIVDTDESGRREVRAAALQRRDGAGLGLVIVARIMTAMGGRIDFGTPDTGALVRLVLEPVR